MNLFSYSANATAQIAAKQTMKQRDQLVEKSVLAAAPKNAAQPHFGCIGPQSLREMDQFIMRNPANPALSNANPGAWVSPPKDALVTKKKTLLKTPEYDVNSIILKTSFANGMRPGQHLYVAPRVLKLGTLEDGYRRYSIGGINRAEDSVKLIYRQIKTGRVSENVLSKARVGDTLKVQGPDWNGFVLPPRSSNMLAFAVGIANIAPMHCLLKTRLKLQEGPLGQTKLFSTYHSPEHEVPYGSQKLARLTSESQGKFEHHTTYSSVGAKTPSEVDKGLKEILKLHDNQSPESALKKILNLETPLPNTEKARVLRTIQQLGHNPTERKKSLDFFMQPTTYVYICGIADVEQTVKHALKLIGHEAGKLKETKACLQKMEDPAIYRWRFEGVRIADQDTRAATSKS